MEEKEKTVAMTIRIKEERRIAIKLMAESMGVTPNRLAATLLEAGFAIAESVAKCDPRLSIESAKLNELVQKEMAKNGEIQ